MHFASSQQLYAQSNLSTPCLWVQAALFMQDGNSFDLSPQSRSTNGTSAGINTVYQILLQPEPGIGFEWVWRQMDEDHSQLYTINGSVPCCIPISPALGDAIFADNSFGSEYYNDSSSSWREYVKEVDGQILGQCNVTTQTATLSWYAITYQLTASNGSLDAYLLGAEWDNTTLKQPPPVAPQGEASGHQPTTRKDGANLKLRLVSLAAKPNLDLKDQSRSALMSRT